MNKLVLMLWKQKNLKPYKVLFSQNTSVLPVNRFVQLDLMITQHAAIISWFYVFSCWCQVFNSLEDSSVMKDKKYYRLYFFFFWYRMFVHTSYIMKLQKTKHRKYSFKNISSDLFLNFIYSSHDCTSLSFGNCPSCLFNSKPRHKIH